MADVEQYPPKFKQARRPVYPASGSFRLKAIALILLPLLLVTHCQFSQQTPEPILSPDAPTATPLLYPPLRPGDGTDLVDRLLETGVIRVGIRVWPGAEFSPPAFRGFSNAETGGALNGFEVDLARQLADVLGLELELVEAYPPVIASGDWQGQWDIALASLVPFDRPGVSYSRPYGYIPMAVLIPAESVEIQDLTDLAGRPVGVLEHSAYEQLLTSREQPPTVWGGQPFPSPLPTEVQPVTLSNQLKAIRELGQPEADPRVDAIFGPAPVFQAAVSSQEPVKLLAAGDELGVQPLVIAIVPQNGLQVERLVQAINERLDRLERRGNLSELYLLWYGQDFSQMPVSESQSPP
jgi:polar amino acid transport system substrate-binding protein